MTGRVVRIAAGQGFWGDWLEAPVRQVRGGPIDYLMMDYLAEVTMSIMDDPMPLARAALCRHFGYPDFRLAQAGVVRSVLMGQDTLAVLPTGAGKSVCFQVPSMTGRA